MNADKGSATLQRSGEVGDCVLEVAGLSMSSVTSLPTLSSAQENVEALRAIGRV
jgi:hypothetical protein